MCQPQLTAKDSGFPPCALHGAHCGRGQSLFSHDLLRLLREIEEAQQRKRFAPEFPAA
jgi:hypothetical protein